MGQTHDDITELVRTLIVQLVDEPDAVKVEGSQQEGDDLFVEVTVAEGDIGKVIGRQGRTVKAIRTLVRAAASQAGFRVEVELAG